MADFDNDLQSIQEARTLATQAREAQRQFLKATQSEVDRICAAMAQAAADAAVTLGKMASEETGYGVPEHKTLKNLLSSQLLWEAIKDIQPWASFAAIPKSTRTILRGPWVWSRH